MLGAVSRMLFVLRRTGSCLVSASDEEEMHRGTARDAKVLYRPIPVCNNGAPQVCVVSSIGTTTCTLKLFPREKVLFYLPQAVIWATKLLFVLVLYRV